MEKKTPNKRKSLANSNATSNKIRKTDSPMSQNKINKSANKNGNKSKSPNKNQNITPKKQVNGNQTKRNNKNEQLEIALNKSANKIKHNQTNGNKSNSLNKNQNITPKNQVKSNQTTPKKQMNDKQIASKKQMNTKQTAPKRNKKSKQEEKDDVELMDNSDEYDNDNSIEEMNYSDVEAAIDEADSDENAQVDEDEESDLDEEKNFDDELENATGDLDAEAEHEEIDEEDNDVNEKKVILKRLERARIQNQKEVQKFISKKALANQEVNVDGNKLFVNANNSTIEFSVTVAGLHPDADVRDVFNDCKIICVSVSRLPTKLKIVNFEDKESMQKALLKSGSEVNGNSITVLLSRKIVESVEHLTVYIYGLNSDVKLEDILQGCNINFYLFRTNSKTHRFNGKVDVAFEDEESVQKALLKHGTEYNGSVIKVYRKYCSVFVNGIKENTKVEKIFTGCKIHEVVLKRDKDTNDLNGALIHFQDYSSCKKASFMKAPPGIKVDSSYIRRYNNNFENRSGFVNNKFNKPPYQQACGHEAKKLLLQELKSQVQKLTKEVYGTSRSRPKPFMFARRNPRINN